MAENKNISSKTNDKLANGASSFYINNGIGSSYKPYPKVRRNTRFPIVFHTPAQLPTI